MFRRSFLSFIGLAGFGAAVSGCPRPLPGPDGGSVTPGGVISVINTVFDVLDTVLPIAQPYFQRFIPDGAAKAAVLASVQVVVTVGNQWKSVAATYRERGGDTCVLFALTGALIDALVRLSRAIVDAGFGWGQEIEGLLNDLGLLLDRLIGRCAADGGVDAGMLAATGRTGSAARAELNAISDAARARGTGLRTLPPLDASSLR